MTAYKFWYCVIWPFFRLVFPYDIEGRENICDGAAMICCNHSYALDPFYVGYAFGRNRQLFFMAKEELFEKPVLKSLFPKVGAFPVMRGEADINCVRTCMKHLKNGERVMLFPEGTRVSPEEHVAAKTGAVRIASKTGVPIIPIFLSRDKKPFQRAKLVIGKPYYVKKPESRDYAAAADELMRRIYELEPKV